MKVVIPNKLELLACSIPETDAQDGPPWSASTAYAVDAPVRYNHVRYSALVANTGKQPDKHLNGEGAIWRKFGATNQYSMLDNFVNTQTTAPQNKTELSFSVTFNRATSFALLNVYASHIHVVTRDDTGEVFFERNYNMVNDLTSFSAFQYCFYPLEAETSVFDTDVPMPILGTLEVTLSATEAPAIGHVVAGRSYFIGSTQYGVSDGELDYSKKKTDDFGVAEFIPRGYANSLSLPLFMKPDRFTAVTQLMRKLRALPALWIGDNDDTGIQALTTFGWKQDFRKVLEGPNIVQATLEINGLI